jgi:hypothetical protein
LREPPFDDRPTGAAPGSPDKLAIMADRLMRKKALFHPPDARPGEDTGLLVGSDGVVRRLFSLRGA